MTADPDLTIIDDLGVTAVAKALDISREAVRQWRLSGTIPDHRRAELQYLVANDIGSDGRPGWPSLSTRLPMVIDQGAADQSDGLIDLDTIAGPNAESKVKAAIAERDARLAGQHASTLATVADCESPGKVIVGAPSEGDFSSPDRAFDCPFAGHLAGK